VYTKSYAPQHDKHVHYMQLINVSQHADLGLGLVRFNVPLDT